MLIFCDSRVAEKALRESSREYIEPAYFRIISYPHYARMTDLILCDDGAKAKCIGCGGLFVVGDYTE